MPFSRLHDTSVVFIARWILDGSENATTMAHANIRSDRCVLALPFTATYFEFTSMRREESSEVEKTSHYADSVRSLNLFLSSMISSIRFNVGFIKSLNELELFGGNEKRTEIQLEFVLFAVH